MKGLKTGGRVAGTPNKESIPIKTVREVFAAAFQELQNGPNNLVDWANENPTEFYKLASKLIPTEITGKDGTAIQPIYILAPSEHGKKVIEGIK